jgi:hypothetical protein
MKKVSLIIAILSLVLVLSACSTVSNELTAADWTDNFAAEDGYARNADTTTFDAETAGETPAETADPAAANRKVIFTYNFTIESDDIDAAAKSLEETAGKSGGFISSLTFGGRNDDGRYADATVTYRIPATDTGSFKTAVETVGKVVNKSENGQDVTESYIDTEGRLSTLRIQEARLLDLLSKSGSLSDLLTIERELANVRGQIESLTGTLKKYDNLVSLATFTVKFQLPKQNVPADGTSFGGAFEESFSIALYVLKSIVIVFIYILPYLLVIGIALTITILILKKKRKNK